MRTCMLVLKINSHTHTPHSRHRLSMRAANRVLVIIITHLFASVSTCRVLGSRNVPFRLSSFLEPSGGVPRGLITKSNQLPDYMPWAPELSAGHPSRTSEALRSLRCLSHRVGMTTMGEGLSFLF